jgi:hypothetical protein
MFRFVLLAEQIIRFPLSRAGPTSSQCSSE